MNNTIIIRKLPDEIQCLIHLAAVLDETAWRLEKAASLLSYPYTKLMAEASALKAGKSRYAVSYAEAKRGVSPFVANQADVERLRLEAKTAAFAAWSKLPKGTEICGTTATAWHHGCPHSPATERRWAVEPRREDGYQEDGAAWFRLLADNGVSNSDNGRPPAVYVSPEEWEITTEGEISHKRGETLMQIGNLRKISGSYAGVGVKARRL